MIRISCLSSAIVPLPLAFGGAALAQTPAKPNIVMIMADDVGIWNISAYHRGMMGGEHAEHRPYRQGRPAVHRLLCSAILHS
jgi:hypothetical protein